MASVGMFVLIILSYRTGLWPCCRWRRCWSLLRSSWSGSV